MAKQDRKDLWEKARQLTSLAEEALMHPKECINCGRIFFSLDSDELEKLNNILPGDIDHSDVDQICERCVNEKYEEA